MGKLIATTQATEGWRDIAEPVGAWADMVNPMPKYVGSNTLSGDLEWNATLLRDLEDAIPKLKDEVDGDLFMHGSGEFAYALAEKGLIDEYEVYLNLLSGGEGNVHVLGDRGTVRMELDDVKRFDSSGPRHLPPARQPPLGRRRGGCRAGSLPKVLSSALNLSPGRTDELRRPGRS